MNLGFGNAALLWGTLAVAVPVVIHLLNRRRYVVQPFAAMQFLRQAYAQRRRRMRMENLLLLLLRCAVVAIAALAMALPQVGSDSPLALLTGGRREVVLILDRSGSTQRRLPGGGSLDDRMVELARRVVGRLSTERGDAVTLITPGAAELLPAPIGATPAVAQAAIDRGLPEPGGVADLVEAVRLLRDRVRPLRQGRLEVELLTDLQELSWREDLGPLFQEVFDQGGGSLSVVDVAADLREPANLGVDRLAAADPLQLAGRAFTVEARVVNHGPVERHGVVGEVFLDGELQRRLEDIVVPARGSTVVEARLRIDSPGAHHVRFDLSGDELSFDDTRTLALDIRDGLDVLLVDGQHGGSRLERASGYLELALQPSAVDEGDDLVGGYRTQVVDTRRFETMGRELFEQDAIVLADVGGLVEDAAETLAEVVASGTPLLIFTGDGVVPRFYDEQLLSRGLLPARVGAPQGDADGDQDYVSLVLSDPPPPALALFADPRLAVLLQVPVLRWSALEPVENAEVLAWFADALGQTVPAIVEARHGLGRVLLVGTSADDSWSLLPRQPATWVPLVHELLASLTAHDPAATNVPLGHGPAVVVDGLPARARLELPSGALEDIPSPEARRLGQRSLLSLAATPLVEAGASFLTVEPSDPVRPVQRLALAALPDAREGDLRRIDGTALGERLTGVEFTLGESLAEQEDVELDPAGDGSLFRVLLWTLLILALAESVLARQTGGAG